MKKIFNILPLFATMLIAGCTNEDFTETQTPASETIPVEIMDESSRTILADGNVVNWTDGDEVMLENAGVHAVYKIVNPSGYKAELMKKTASDAEIVIDENLKAYYPASSYVSENTINMPLEQTYSVVDGKQKIDGAQMSGTYNKWAKRVEFRNLCAMLKINVKGCGVIRGIEVSSTVGSLSGNCTIANNTATVTSEGISKARLRIAQGVNTADGADFYIAVPVSTGDGYEGLQVKLINSQDFESSAQMAKENATIKRNTIYSLKFNENVSFGLNCVDLGIKGKDGNTLYFAPKNVGAIFDDDFGDYFCWAATVPLYNSCAWQVTKSGSDYQWTATFDWRTDVPAPSAGYDQRNAPYYSYTDNYTKYTQKNSKLDETDDAATQKYGSNYRMPYESEITSLKNGCYLVYVKDYKNTHKAGFIIYKLKEGKTAGVVMNGYTPDPDYDVNTDTHIFIPFAGFVTGQTIDTARPNTGAYFWMNETKDSQASGRNYWFSGSNISCNDNRGRGYGFSIRGVTSTNIVNQTFSTSFATLSDENFNAE
ncbi:MAG: fimbrillin family protein [Prevotella sp.]|nr:fimbrillin family protein [Prevotella sp.]